MNKLRKNQTLEEVRLTKELIHLYNHKKSTSFSLRAYLRIVKTIDYALLYSRGGDSFKQQFDSGIKTLDAMKKELLFLLAKLQATRLPFQNERYQDVIDHQVPNYIKKLNGYRGIFTYCTLFEDLDYPLCSGLLMDENNGLEGIDLAIHYLRRLDLEQEFLLSYKKELEVFLETLEKERGISIELLNLNLASLVLTCCLGKQILHKKGRLVFSEAEIHTLRRVLKMNNYTALIRVAYSELGATMKPSVRDYLSQFISDQESRFKDFIELDTMIFVVEVQNISENRVLVESCVSDFNDLLEKLYSLDFDDKLELLKTQQIGYIDLVDCLENNIFTDEELQAFFIFKSN